MRLWIKKINTNREKTKEGTHSVGFSTARQETFYSNTQPHNAPKYAENPPDSFQHTRISVKQG
jgi:hypothetical protein